MLWDTSVFIIAKTRDPHSPKPPDLSSVSTLVIVPSRSMMSARIPEPLAALMTSIRPSGSAKRKYSTERSPTRGIRCVPSCVVKKSSAWTPYDTPSSVHAISPRSPRSTCPACPRPWKSRSTIQLSPVPPGRAADASAPPSRRAMTASPVVSLSIGFSSRDARERQPDSSMTIDSAAAPTPDRRTPLRLSDPLRFLARVPLLSGSSVCGSIVLIHSRHCANGRIMRPHPSLGHEARAAPSQAPDTAQDNDTEPRPRAPTPRVSAPPGCTRYCAPPSQPGRRAKDSTLRLYPISRFRSTR